jgi:hypothetical protein
MGSIPFAVTGGLHENEDLFLYMYQDHFNLKLGIFMTIL